MGRSFAINLLPVILRRQKRHRSITATSPAHTTKAIDRRRMASLDQPSKSAIEAAPIFEDALGVTCVTLLSPMHRRDCRQLRCTTHRLHTDLHVDQRPAHVGLRSECLCPSRLRGRPHRQQLRTKQAETQSGNRCSTHFSLVSQSLRASASSRASSLASLSSQPL
jgi:hypothetical protein